MMAQWVLDYSFARPAISDMMAKGYTGVVRYLSPPPNGKNLDAAERDALLAAGLDIGLVWETSATRAEQGYNAGLSDAHRANGYADALNYPAGATIWYAVDENIPFAQVADYFRGIKDAGGRPWSAYGNEETIDSVAGMGAAMGWQVSTWDDGSGPRVSPHAALVQEANMPADVGGTDINSVHADNWGGWLSHGAALKGAKLTPEEHDMLVTTAGSVAYLRDEVEQIKTAIGFNTAESARLKDIPVQIDALAARLSGGIDLDALAGRVADLLAKRLAS